MPGIEIKPGGNCYEGKWMKSEGVRLDTSSKKSGL